MAQGPRKFFFQFRNFGFYFHLVSISSLWKVALLKENRAMSATAKTADTIKASRLMGIVVIWTEKTNRSIRGKTTRVPSC